MTSINQRIMNRILQYQGDITCTLAHQKAVIEKLKLKDAIKEIEIDNLRIMQDKVIVKELRDLLKEDKPKFLNFVSPNE